MPYSVKVVGPSFKKQPSVISQFKSTIVVNTTSKAGWYSQLSPFLLGPVELYNGLYSLTMENAWQYSKVYPQQVDVNGNPSWVWKQWAVSGWNNPKAVRYPMGKGAKPLYSIWNDQKLNYIEARKVIYIPLYASAVVKTEAFKRLQDMYNRNYQLILWDYDGYDHLSKQMSFENVMQHTGRPMGHAFVLAMLLEKHPIVSKYL